ncbi:MAG: phospholipase D family protein [Nitrospira sp.]|nr:phospholipase D family protein [Nitrospira sp.]
MLPYLIREASMPLFLLAALLTAASPFVKPSDTNAQSTDPVVVSADAGRIQANKIGLESWAVCFTPSEDCTGEIVKVLEAAHTSILVQAYSFTSAPIAKALVDAHKRNVKVEVILDRSQRTEKYSSADFLAHAGIQTLIDTAHAIAHSKVMVIDNNTVITGSFNFTRSAQERNAENLLVIRNKSLADRYTENWNIHADHSGPYLGRDAE